MTFSVSNLASSCADPMSSMSRDPTARAIVKTCGSRSLGGFDDEKRATMEEGDYCRTGQDLMATCHDVWWGMDVFPYGGLVRGPFVVAIRDVTYRTSPRENE